MVGNEGSTLGPHDSIFLDTGQTRTSICLAEATRSHGLVVWGALCVAVAHATQPELACVGTPCDVIMRLDTYN